ncbi:MAG TPA: NAD-dependent epimerase/dehydratase family protein [Polyangia bacterium]|nr:NAD-dependent epimerase/dehydratase family protein [Polyangia bacterium]
MTSRRAFLQGSLAAAAAMTFRPRIAAAAKPKKILILGGTGFLGPALVAAARAHGHTLTLFNRGKTNPGRFADLEQLHGDRDGHLEALGGGRKWDVVIDDSGYVPRHVKDSATLLAPNVGHYLFVSTISVYADLGNPADENAPVAKLKEPTEKVTGETYGALKALCEEAASAAMPGRVTVVRPGLIVGPEDPTDRFTYWPVRLQRGGEVLAPGDPKDPVAYIDVRDLANWMVWSVVEKHLLGTFNALGPAHTFGVGEMLDGVNKGAGKKARLTWVDAAFLEKQGVQPWSDMPVWVPPVGDGKYSGLISRARAVKTGLTFRSAADTTRDTLAWWNALPEARRSKLRAGLAADKEQTVLAAWHARGDKPDAKTDKADARK